MKRFRIRPQRTVAGLVWCGGFDRGRLVVYSIEHSMNCGEVIDRLLARKSKRRKLVENTSVYHKPARPSYPEH